MAKKPSKGGYVYLTTESGTKRFKVGRSGEPEERLVKLQTGNSRNLELYFKKWFTDMAKAEGQLLQKLREKNSSFRSCGGGTEWFSGDVAKAKKILDTVIQ